MASAILPRMAATAPLRPDSPGRARPNWRHLPAILIAAGFVLPLVFMVTGSLRKAGRPPPRTPELIPSPIAFDNYARAFELVNLPRYTLNSLVVVAFAVPLTILFASWAGFAMSRLPARAAGILVALSLISLMVPVTRCWLAGSPSSAPSVSPTRSCH